jgi:hypothetical protein
MQKDNLLSGFFFLLISIFVCQQSLVIGMGSLRHPGSGLLPFAVGLGLGVLALVLLFLSTRAKERETTAKNERMLRKGKFWLVSLSLIGYTTAVDMFGFVPSTFAFVFLLLYFLKFGRIWLMAVSAALITGANYLVFGVWLGLSLPVGFLIR